MGPPRFLTSLFLRAMLFDPGRPSMISPISDPFVLPSETVSPSYILSVGYYANCAMVQMTSFDVIVERNKNQSRDMAAAIRRVLDK